MQRLPIAEASDRNPGITMNPSASSMSAGHHWRIVVAAALRLSALYAAGVAILSAALNRVGPPDETLMFAGTEGAIFLGLAFVALIAARRRALYAVWTFLLVLWTMALMARRIPWSAAHAFTVPPLFAMWTVLAMPLAIIAALAATDSQTRHGRHRAIVWLLLAAWLLLAVIGRHYRYMNGDVPMPNAPYHAEFVAAWCVWAPAPFVLAAWSIRAWHRAARGELATSG